MAVLIAVTALIFTVASFWWINVRPGRLEAYQPETFAGYIQRRRRSSDDDDRPTDEQASGPGDFRLRLPLTIFNTGARAHVVTDMRTVFLDEGITAPVISFRHSIKPIPDDVVDFAHPFAVPARATATRFVEFGHTSWAPGKGSKQRVRVDARIGRASEWRPLITFEIAMPSVETAGVYIAHRRDPTDKAPPPDR